MYGEVGWMNAKWIGAILVIVGCGSYGFSLTATHKNQEQTLRQMITALESIGRELAFRLVSLPELCRHASGEIRGVTNAVFSRLAEELERQQQPDAAGCMELVLSKFPELSPKIREIFSETGHCLGQYDLPGQLESLKSLASACRRELELLEENRASRLRCYQTLSLSAGAALAILFL